jgi:hypothetical protein
MRHAHSDIPSLRRAQSHLVLRQHGRSEQAECKGKEHASDPAS